MSMPIGNLIGWTLGEALNHMIPAEVVCGRCQFSLAASDYHEHRTIDHSSNMRNGRPTSERLLLRTSQHWAAQKVGKGRLTS